MSSDLRWIVEGRVLYSRYFGEVTIDQVKAGAAAFVRFLNELQAPEPIHVIYNNRLQTKGPTNMAQLQNITKDVFAHPAIGWNVLIIDNPLNKFLASIIVQVVGAEWRVANSHEEAITTLQRLDHTLPPLDRPTIMHFD